MIHLYIILACYTGIGLLIYSVAVNTPIPRKEQLRYSIVWPWLFIAALGYFLWESLFPPED